MTKKYNFPKEVRTYIAEFIFGYQTDILIKPDAINLVNALKGYNIIEKPDKIIHSININEGSIVDMIFMTLTDKISETERKEIMQEYYSKA